MLQDFLEFNEVDELRAISSCNGTRERKGTGFSGLKFMGSFAIFWTR